MNISSLQQEHDKYNEVYVNAKTELFSSSEATRDEFIAIANTRLDKLNETMAGISETSVSYIEDVDLFASFFDDVVLECAELTNRRAQVEEKIIALCKKALEKPIAENTRNAADEHVTAKLVDCLSVAPSAEVGKNMAAALLDETNPLRLGLTYYEKFCKENPSFADSSALEYMELESEVRSNLVTGNVEAVLTALEKLIPHPHDCAEKYLLLSLNSFYHGFEDEAKRALEIGLGKFPENERLLFAKTTFV